MIKILIGGSPCTQWSIAQKQSRETEPSGLGWELFKNYVIAKEKFKPDVFLYENVGSASPRIKEAISDALKVDLVRLNSALVSAQNRDRIYGTNVNVPIPEDRHIYLRDILEHGIVEREKSYPIAATYGKKNERDYFKKHHGQVAFEPVRIGTIENDAKTPEHDSKQYRVYSPDGKSTALCGQGGGVGAKTGLYATPLIDCPACLRYERTDEGKRLRKAYESGQIKHGFNEHRQLHPRTDGKSNTISTVTKDNMIIDAASSNERPIYEVRNGIISIKGIEYPIELSDGFYIIRKLTVKECCRLQTLPDDYCNAVSNTQAYKGLGNGWTAEMIIHILNASLRDVPRSEKLEVLSLYDRIGTGMYCLKKMGFTNIKYSAFEIDKYAIQIAKRNHPVIIEHGDAFAVRNADFNKSVSAGEYTDNPTLYYGA